MALDVERVDLWTAEVADKPGAAADKLAALAEAGASLDMVSAWRSAAGKGTLAVVGLKGAAQARAARAAGFEKVDKAKMCLLRVEGRDKKGLGAEILGALAEGGLNLAKVQASVIGRKFVCYIGLDSSKDATAAGRVLRNL
jgi:predicted amino acid-binding ACT domain protein